MVKIEFSHEDIKEAGIVYSGLVLNYIIGPLMETIVSNYEEPNPSYKYSMLLFRGGFLLRSLFIAILRLSGNSRIANAAAKAKPLSQTELSDLIRRQKALQLKMKTLWSDWGIEAIL